MKKTSAPDRLQELSQDSGIHRMLPRVAYVAETESEVAQALQEAGAAGLAVTPRGGGTSIPGQAVGSGALLLQRGERTALGSDWVVVCHPSTVKADLNGFLGPDRWVPVDPSSYASCTVGGMVANNASGIRTPEYGSTVDYVTELRAVVPGEGPSAVIPMAMEEALTAEPRTRKIASLILENQSAIVEDRPKVTKNSSGYRLEKVLHDGIFDLPKLFAGSEGTLGVMTEVSLSTKRRPSWKSLFIAEAPLEELDKVVSAFRVLGPSALELVDKSVFRMTEKWGRISEFSRSEGQYMVFCEFDGGDGDGLSKAEEVAESEAGGYDPIFIESAADISRAWDTRNETLSIAQGIKKGSAGLVPGVEDLVVPPEKLGDLLRLLSDQFGKRGLDHVIYGHAGDANLHARPFVDLGAPKGMATLEELMEDCFEWVWKMGGSMTGEHGDGRLRAKYVQRQYPRSHWIMREVKEAFDPKGLLNPGVKIV